MKLLKKSVLLLAAWVLLFTAAGARAEEAGAESVVGTWYLEEVVIGGDAYDVSRSSEEVTVRLNGDRTGAYRASPAEEETSVAWTKDENGELVYIDVADGGIRMRKMFVDGDRLTVADGERTYVLGRTGTERSGIPYGMAAEFAWSAPEGAEESPEQLAGRAMEVIRERLEKEGCAGAAVWETETGRIRVEIPDTQDEALLDVISAPGEVKFLGPDDSVILTGEQVRSAEYFYQEGMHIVLVTLTDEGSELFADATTRNVGRNIRVTLDGEVLVDATVQSPITGGSCIISGNYTKPEAVGIAARMESGSLPVKADLVKLERITDVRHAEAAAAAKTAGEEDAAIVILKLGDREVTKAEVQEAVENELYQMYLYYSMYGVSLDTTDPEVIASVRESAVASLKQDMALRAKAAELGLDQLTEEETARAQGDAQESWEYARSYVRTYYLTAEQQQLEGEALDQAILDVLEELGVTYEDYLASATDNIVDEKLREYAVKDVTITEEQIRTEYDSRVAADREKYEEDPNAWTRMDLNGTTTYYTPAGIRYVKQILLKFREEDRAAIDAAETKITEAENRKAAAQQILEEAAAAEEDLDAARDELAAAEAELEAARTERKDALETAFATLDEEADAILDALAENPDSWDRLMEEKNEDPGLMAGAIHAEKGYAVCEGMTSFDAAFVNAAMALEQVGSVSGKVRGESYGYYIIRYVSDAPEGPADYDAVKEILRSSLLASGQSDAYSAAIAQWVAEAGIEENLEALDN